MKSESKSAPLIKDVLTIRSRYVRAVNIGRDIGDEQALQGYLLTDSVRLALSRLCDGLLATSNQRAWRITGGYGGGKSALGLLIASLFTQPLTKRSVIGGLLNQDAPELWLKVKKLPRYELLIVTGARSDASVAIANALHELINARRSSPSQKLLLDRLSAFSDARKRRECPPLDVIKLLQDCCHYLSSGANAVEGLLIIVDELGRWLEYAADPETDLDASFFQTLAETCGGKARDIPLSIIGILHQRFEDYAEGRRDRRSGLEWAKVAERFEEITFSQSFESTCHLITRALDIDQAACKRTGVTAKAKKLFETADTLGILRNTVSDTTIESGAMLYPLHPSALVAAMTLFRRFGQNERSTFSFLMSSEPFALQDFIDRNRLDPDTWYRIYHLCDWLLAQGTLRSQEEERLKRWALLQDVLRAAPVYDDIEIKCLKVVGLLNLLEPQPGLLVTADTIAFAIADDVTNKPVRDAITKLLGKSLLYIRPATQELCLWPQSSVDISSELNRIRKAAPALLRLGTLIEHLPSARPIVAHRHYLETGTLRAAQVVLIDDIEDISKQLMLPRSTDGQILIVPCYPDQNAKSISKRIERISAEAEPGILFALRVITEDDLEVAEELLAWRQVERECTELRIDAYARTEVLQTIHRLTATLVHRLADLRVPSQAGHSAHWWHKGMNLPISDGKSLNRSLSEIFGALYSKAPSVRNELINRTSVSSAAAGARQRLLERVFTHAEVENLGIEQTPPEKAIYLSVLKETGLHRQVNDQWMFCSPEKNSLWTPAWLALNEMLDQQGLVSVQEIILHFSLPPFGMRESVILILVSVFLRVNRQNIILRERGTYLTRIEDSHLARILKRPETFELHMVNAQSSITTVLEVYCNVLQAYFNLPKLEPTVSELTRQLYAWYLTLPEHTLNTTKLSPQHRAALALMGKAGDPVELLTVGLPIALDVSKKAGPFHAKSKLELNLLHSALDGLLRTAGGRLDILRKEILKTLAEEIGVRDVDAVRPHIVALAEKAQDELVDYALKAFIQRSCDGKRTETQWIDSLASLLGGRTIEAWHDDSLLRFRAELRRVFTLLTRVVALAKLTHKHDGRDHSVVALHVVDQKGQERFVALPADANGVLPAERMDELRAMIESFSVPAYAIARLLLDYSIELPPEQFESIT